MNIEFDITLILFVSIVGIAVLLFELGLLRTVYSDEEQKKRHLKKRLADVRNTLRAQPDDEITRKNLNANNTLFAKIVLKLPGGSYVNHLIDRTGQKTTLTRTIALMFVFSIVAGGVAWITNQELQLKLQDLESSNKKSFKIVEKVRKYNKTLLEHIRYLGNKRKD